MPHHVLIIEDRAFGSELGGECVSLLGTDFHCERIRWDLAVGERLDWSNVALIVALATSQPAQARNLLDALHDLAVSIPLLAVLPESPDKELLQAACNTADDFVFLPLRQVELRRRVGHLLGALGQKPGAVCDRLEEEIELARLAGRDEVFLRAIEKIPLIATSEAPVLLLGETGTGKEVCARAIHNLSQRRNLPFIPVECGAIPEQLAENEFFGHCRGAFTDAHIDQKGLAAMAEGGTLFLDEIDSLSLGVQAKLLRFLEEGSYRSLGGDRLRQANVRIIAAANRDLESLVAEKQFRADLYFRVNVLQIRLPALRERRGDIGLLAGHFLDMLSGRDGARRKTLSPGALHRLEQHDWPGNVRELFNLVQRVIALCPDPHILAAHIPLSASTSVVSLK
jgi:DNA-binding NtrC family response regulator